MADSGQWAETSLTPSSPRNNIKSTQHTGWMTKDYDADPDETPGKREPQLSRRASLTVRSCGTLPIPVPIPSLHPPPGLANPKLNSRTFLPRRRSPLPWPFPLTDPSPINSARGAERETAREKRIPLPAAAASRETPRRSDRGRDPGQGESQAPSSPPRKEPAPGEKTEDHTY